jgi:flagellar hook-associated protein 1
MAGLVSVLSIAKDALTVQQYGMEVTSHNIANVGTEGYSRQKAIPEAKRPVPYAGQIFGTGVRIDEIIRNVDGFVEARVLDRTMELACVTEKQILLGVLEGLFDVTSGASLASQFSDFWNAWHDLSNNPSGPAERDVLLETGSSLAQGFADLAVEMRQIINQINLSLQAGITRINELTSQLAALNGQIAHLGAMGNANDLQDQRGKVLNELAGYLDIKSFENTDGGITVMTKSGHVLVDKVHAYRLNLEDNEVKWEGSGGAWIPITDTLLGGKLGGWLDIRDAVIPKYQADLDELAKATIWEVNKIHTQGVGLYLYGPGRTLTSTYQAVGVLGDPDLTFGDRIDYSSSFNLWVGDRNGGNLQSVTIDLTALGIDETSSLGVLAAGINAAISAEGLIGLSADVSTSGDRLVFSADNDHTFGFSDDGSHILAALGVNTFFTGSGAMGMDLNPVIFSDSGFVAAARIDPVTGETAAGDGSNALAMADLQYQGVSVQRWRFERGTAPTPVEIGNITLEDYFHSLVGSVGLQSRSMQAAREYNEVIAAQLRKARESISGVSLDEEMADMIKFQHAFLAAAKLISAADDMLRALIEAK